MTANKSDIGSDLAKVDAYQLTDKDYDEIPEATDADFARATVNRGGVPMRGRPSLGDKAKKQLTLRLDPEIIARFRATGNGWQGRINDYLGANSVVLRLISENEELIGDMESMLVHFRTGELRMMFESSNRTIAGVELNIRNVKETVRSLKEQLVLLPA